MEFEESCSEHAKELREDCIEPAETLIEPLLKAAHVLLQPAKLLKASAASLAGLAHHLLAAPERGKDFRKAVLT